MRFRIIACVIALLMFSACGGLAAAQSSVRQHTACPEATYSGPVWSPDGVTVYYSFQRGVGFDHEIRAIDTHSDADRLVAPGGELPQVSPDGRQVLYRRPVTSNRWDIYLADSSGAAAGREVLQTTTGNTAFSPDGKWIASVDAMRGETTDLYLYNIQTGQSHVLTDSPGNDINPVWSPDGSQIAFASDREGTYLIYRINADGSGEQRLTEFTSTCYRSPHFDDVESWLPDGSGVAYSRYCDTYRSVQVVDLNGVRIADWGALKHQSQWPEWSPDGTQIVYMVVRNNTYVIRAMNADLSHDRALAEDAWSPHWSPDGRQIVYVSYDANRHTALFLMDVESGFSAPLTHNPGSGVCFH